MCWISSLEEYPQSIRDVYFGAEFTGRADVTWEAQIEQHGDGQIGGPRYAYKDPFFNASAKAAADLAWEREHEDQKRARRTY